MKPNRLPAPIADALALVCAAAVFVAVGLDHPAQAATQAMTGAQITAVGVPATSADGSVSGRGDPRVAP